MQAAVMGHSMGGHGALVLGLRNPNLYKSISAFSPISNPTNVPWGQKAFSGYLGDDKEEWKQYDATELVRGNEARCLGVPSVTIFMSGLWFSPVCA
jgi:S-formylglutathione hydrolase